MKRKHLNLALAAAVLVLAAATYFSREQPEPPPPPLTALKADDINRILVRHAGRDDIRLEKRGATWWLTAPVEARAERIEVGALLELAGRASQRRYPAAEMDLAKLGLAPSDWSIQLNDVRLEFGGLDPIESRRYVRLGETVHLIEDPPSAALDADYHDLVARRLLPEDAQLTRIQLPGLSLTRSDKTGWTVTPAGADQGADAAQALADAWLRAQAMWVTPLDRRRRAQGEVRIQAGEESFRFVILDRQDQLLLARPELGVQFALSKTLASELFQLKAPPEPETQTQDPAADKPETGG